MLLTGCSIAGAVAAGAVSIGDALFGFDIDGN